MVAPWDLEYALTSASDMTSDQAHRLAVTSSPLKRVSGSAGIVASRASTPVLLAPSVTICAARAGSVSVSSVLSTIRAVIRPTE